MPQDAPDAYEAFVPLNLPIPQAQPEFLFAVAQMRGMKPRAVDEARVLEIGCGNGNNLLPLAERYPQSSFLGVDTSQQQIAAAQKEAQALELENIEFRQQSLADFRPEDGPFDYVIAAGIYSWVDAAGRDAVLAACQQHGALLPGCEGCLAPQGIAYVNYNVYPGWHVHELLRTMMCFQARGSDTVARRAAAGRTLLEFLAASLPADDDPYSAQVRAAVEFVQRQPDALLYRNYLQEAGHAVYFKDFAAHATKYSLQVLGDASLGIRLSDFLAGSVERGMKKFVTDAGEKEQFRDLLQGRAHRQSLLCSDIVKLEAGLGAWRMEGLYLEGQLTPENADAPLDSPEPSTFIVPGGTSVTASLPSIKAALAHLGSAWPNYVSFTELRRVASAHFAHQEPGESKEPSETVRLQNNLLQCCIGGVIRLHGAPQSFVSNVSDRPTAGPVARRRAAFEDVVTNRKHLRIRLEPFDRHVLVLLDGTRSVQDVFDYLLQLAAKGQVRMIDQGREVPQDRAAEFLRGELAASLDRLAADALLMA